MCSKILIIEAIGRLPGPLATSLLLDRGYDVLKVESETSRDPFSLRIDNKTGAFFNAWYEKLSKGKKTFCFMNEDEEQELHKKLLLQILSYKKIIILSSLKNAPTKK